MQCCTCVPGAPASSADGGWGVVALLAGSATHVRTPPTRGRPHMATSSRKILEGLLSALVWVQNAAGVRCNKLLKRCKVAGSPSTFASHSLLITRRAGCSISWVRMMAAAARPYWASSADEHAASRVRFLHTMQAASPGPVVNVSRIVCAYHHSICRATKETASTAGPAVLQYASGLQPVCRVCLVL